MDEEIDSRFILFSPWTFLFLFLVIIIGNLFIIDIALLSNKTLNLQSKPLATANGATNLSATNTNNSCPITCVDQIKQATLSAVPIKNAPKLSTTTSNNNVKEFFVPLGSGSSTSSDWEDVPGASGYIDNTAYGPIKQATFEVSLYTPTGNQMAMARLYNVTDSHPVWNSDVEIDGGTPQLKISAPILLTGGSKLYQVQMKTQLQARTNLENARVHIITY